MTDSLVPDFFVLGSPKCGTTWLQAALTAHPQIAMTSPKECNVLSREMDAEGLGVDLFRRVNSDRKDPRIPRNWRALYRTHLEDVGPGRIVGDGSLTYIRPAILEFIAREMPDARFLFIMRDPIERLKSARLHRIKDGRGMVDIDDTIAAWRNGDSSGAFLIEAGLYGRRLDSIFAVLPRDRVLVLVMERMLADAAASRATLTRIFDFLGVDSALPVPLPGPTNVAKKPRSPFLAQQFRKLETSLLVKRIRALPYVETAPPSRMLRKMRNMNLVTPARADKELTAEQERQLSEIFAADAARLEVLLGDRFPEWTSLRQPAS